MEGDPWWNGHLVVVSQREASYLPPSRIAVLALGESDVTPGNDAVRDAVLEPIGWESRDVDETSRLHVWGSSSGFHELFIATAADLAARGVVTAMQRLLAQARAARPNSRKLTREEAESRVGLYLGRAYQGDTVRVTSASEKDDAWAFRAEVAGQVIEGTIDATGALLVADCSA